MSSHESYGHALTSLRLVQQGIAMGLNDPEKCNMPRRYQRVYEAAHRAGLAVPPGYDSYKARD